MIFLPYPGCRPLTQAELRVGAQASPSDWDRWHGQRLPEAPATLAGDGAPGMAARAAATFALPPDVDAGAATITLQDASARVAQDALPDSGIYADEAHLDAAALDALDLLLPVVGVQMAAQEGAALLVEQRIVSVATAVGGAPFASWSMPPAGPSGSRHRH